MTNYERERARILKRERRMRIVYAVIAWGLLLLATAAFMFTLWLLIGMTFALFGTPPGFHD